MNMHFVIANDWLWVIESESVAVNQDNIASLALLVRCECSAALAWHLPYTDIIWISSVANVGVFAMAKTCDGQVDRTLSAIHIVWHQQPSDSLLLRNDIRFAYILSITWIQTNIFEKSYQLCQLPDVVIHRAFVNELPANVVDCFLFQWVGCGCERAKPQRNGTCVMCNGNRTHKMHQFAVWIIPAAVDADHGKL